MRRTMALAVVSGLVLAAAAFANAGPAPLPKDRKVAEPPVKFEGIDKHADHVFVLNYGAVYFGNEKVELKDMGAIKLDFKTKDSTPSAYMTLYAMERKEFEKRKKDDPSLKWLASGKDGVISVKLTPPETTIPATAKDTLVTTYRVTFEMGKLSAEKVDQKKSAAPPAILAPWAFGLISSFSLVWLGLWCARRGEPRTMPGNET